MLVDKGVSGKVIMLTGRKGGIGKSIDNELLSIVGSQIFNKDICLIDYDQQRNTTSNISSTYQISKFERSLASAITNNDWESGITKISPHLYVMAGSPGSEELNEHLSQKYPNKHDRHLAFIQPLKRVKKEI